MNIRYLAVPGWILVWLLAGLRLQAVEAQQPQPTPTVDRLAIPTLPAHPSQVDLGRSLYYHNCMPCHGDTGQGLTAEFIALWEEDHQDCWGRGCHGGRTEDEGFPIPTTIPALNVASRSEQLFASEADLYDYLRRTHPPQNPGVLQDDEYRALAVYTFWLSGRPVAPSGADQRTLALLGLAAAGLGALLAAVLLPRRHPRDP